ncbi:YolD-like protein [Brevibacillus sp. AG162]|uniref:YolD-like family protein n=1 Tax=Brevibacillus sp. AG162 TaxID=2572910 RepID=UPI00114DB8A5|nr:YolD-like family protein [Brevibacillus sp. AG162]TQK75002.1 YolD-like protein [Brevibacillus sp. AG162]
MTLLYEHHYEHVVTPLLPIDADLMAEMYVIIYDSVSKDFAIAVSWYEKCIRREWGVVKNIDRDERKIKLIRDDGCWWIPIDNLLQVERV